MRSSHCRRGRGRGRDRGVAIVYTALMATVIAGFAGFSVDFGRWYVEAARTQNATDAAALGAVVFVGSDFNTADDIARELMEGHGYDDADQIDVEYGDSANQVRVTVRSSVENIFAPIFGVDTTMISRSALAEYLGPIPLGSPENSLGNDPDSATDAPDYWLNIAGPDSTKASGDRFAAKVCGSAVANCDAGENPNNLDYSNHGYFFSVDVGTPTGDDLQVELFDGVMAYVGDKCEKEDLPDAAQRTTLAGLHPRYADANVRYAPDNDPAQALFCTGDQRINGKNNVELTVIVRAPDDTPWLSTDNPIVDTSDPSSTISGSCSPMTLPSFDTTPDDRIYELLHPSDGKFDAEGVFDPDDGFLSFAEMFRQWAPVCTIDGDDVVAGEYLVQLRTNVTSFDKLNYDPSVNTGGHNRFSMRVGFDHDDNDATPVQGNGSQLYARGKFPIYANKDGANTEFYLARVDDRYAGRSLNVTFFDLGDAASAGTLRVKPPEEATANGSDLDSFSGCTFFMDDGGKTNNVPGECKLKDVSKNSSANSDSYQGRLVEVVVPIPDGYTCDKADPFGCWIKVLADFPGGVNDTTTWSAEIIGDPVRLIE